MDTIDYVALFEQSQDWSYYRCTQLYHCCGFNDFIKKTKPRVRALQRYFVVYFLNPEDRTGDGEIRFALFCQKNKTADTLLTIIGYDIPKRHRRVAGLNQKYWKVINSLFLTQQ
jgi:hypothetical protein